MNLIIPENYNPVLDLRDTEIAIKLVKDFFETELSRALNLTRVSAPIMVTPESAFRTEKLSPAAAMILRETVGK